MLGAIECVQAQTRSISGRITDFETGDPLIGAAVQVKGTTSGAITDVDGNFKLSVNEDATDIVVSYLGYLSEEQSIGNRTVIDIQLMPDLKTLSEVVVMGMSEQRMKKDLTSAISTVSAEQIERVPFASPEFAIQGQAPGVRVLNTSGNPSDGPEIFIRGMGTFAGSNQPLYVIDGQVINPMTSGNQDEIGNVNLWTMINPADIASISVLKDASSAAIYGSRAANGVVLITTKNGRKGKPVIEVNSQVGIQNIPTFDMLNTEQYIMLNRERYSTNRNPGLNIERDFYGREQTDMAAVLGGFNPQFDPESPYYLGSDPQTYDWQQAIINKDALVQNHNIKVSGAGENSDYYLGVGYTDQQGVIIGSDLSRYNVTANVNTFVGKYIKAGVNIRGAYQESQENQPGDLITAAQTPPWQPIYDPSNPTGFAPAVITNLGVDADGNPNGSWSQVKRFGQSTQPNIIARNALNYGAFVLTRSMGQGYVQVDPFKGLSIRGSLNLDYTWQQRQRFRNAKAQQGFGTTDADPAAIEGSKGSYSLRTNRVLNYQADLNATYARTFNDHSIIATGVVQDVRYIRNIEDLSTRRATTDDLDRINIGSDDANTQGFSGRDQKFWFGYVGKLGYNFKSRYYLDLSFRRDGSVGFQEDKRWGNFYSVSGAWRVSDESFMQGIGFINDLKLRAGWGQTGNDEAVVGQYRYLAVVGDGSSSYGWGVGPDPGNGNYTIGGIVNRFPNADISWEVSTTTNLGLDATFLNNHFNMSFDIYQRITDGILQTVPLAPSVGTDDPTFNIGKVQNRGIDLLLGYNGNAGAFTYNISANTSLVRNEVLNLYEGTRISIGPDGDRWVEVGQPIGYIRGYQVGGIFQSQAEIDAYYAQYPDENVGDVTHVAPGDLYFRDVLGDPTEAEGNYSLTPDGQINAFDQANIGNTIPGITYGFNLSGGWKGLDLSIGFYGEGDVQKYNYAKEQFERISTQNSWTT
ncbi:MAG: SusC/RagA family TonB-linked outer membrane protein, partial [Bacteroidetes bacterium]|nr:SusC/RagA family TonB-linked outer membrane protein [Bacteroidota bacterium]